MSPIAAEYVETTGSLARKAEVLPETIRAYADAHLVDHIRLANGQRLFRSDALIRVRALLEERRARRGGRHGVQGAA